LSLFRGKPLKVLLVEDSPEDAFLQMRALRVKPDVTVDVSHIRRLDELPAAYAGTRPDAILLDLGLPDSAGLESLTTALKTAESTPIIVLTGQDDEAVGLESLRRGAQDYVVKGTLDGPLLIKTILFAVERQHLMEQVQYAALHDSLTGIPNRQLFLSRLKNALARARRTEERFTVAYMDLDGFKPVNDQHGHDGGDAVLVAIAARLTERCRSEDTVARIGGDEFAVLLERTGGADAERVLTEMRWMLRGPIQLPDGASVTVDCSIGLAEYPTHGDCDHILLRRADTAMYAAKGCADHSVVHWSESLGES